MMRTKKMQLLMLVVVAVGQREMRPMPRTPTRRRTTTWLLRVQSAAELLSVISRQHRARTHPASGRPDGKQRLARVYGDSTS